MRSLALTTVLPALICISSTSRIIETQAFSTLGAPSSYTTTTLTNTKSTHNVVPLSPFFHTTRSTTTPAAISTTSQQHHSRQRLGPLFASSNQNIIPYYNELMERLPSKKVIQTIDKSNGSPIVASDLATKAGISLTQARKDLTTLASLTRGDIAVSNEGELIYTFPSNVNGVLSSNSAKYRALTTWKEKIFPPLFYATRVGFGVALLASLVAIYSTIFFVMTSSSSSDRDDDRRDRRGGGMPMMGGFWGPSPFDFFYYRPYYSRYYYSPAYGNVDRGSQGRDPEEMGFLESVL